MYNWLIAEQSGLPLLRVAGRMVGWWNTLVGDLYEHVTIWEYDDMAAFEKAIQFLSKDATWRRSVVDASRPAARPERRADLLRLASRRAPPSLPEPSPFVVHEVHRVPLARRAEYLAFMARQGSSDLLKAHGFRPAGPWVVDVAGGRQSRRDLLVRVREPGRAAKRLNRPVSSANHADASEDLTADKVGGFTEEVTTRLLIPAPFAKAASTSDAPPKPASSARAVASGPQLAPGVYVAGFSDRHQSANCGWVALGASGDPVDRSASRHPPARIPGGRRHRVATESNGRPDAPCWTRATPRTSRDLDPFSKKTKSDPRTGGCTRTLTGARRPRPTARGPSHDVHRRCLSIPRTSKRTYPDRTPIGDSSVPVDFLPIDEAAGWGQRASAPAGLCCSPALWSSTARAPR